MSESQLRYSQIEKEALSIIFGCKKFHQYLYGRKFILLTDHKPLVTLFHPNKQLPVMTAQRLQRWAITLMGYNYEVRYRETLKHSNADCLSRLPMGPDTGFDKENECNELFSQYDNQIKDFPVDSQIIQQHTLSDPVLYKVAEYLDRGWPERCTKLPEIAPYFSRKLCITNHNNILLLQTDHLRVIIPTALRQRVLQLLHEGHWGIVRMKQMARQHCWWPTLDRDIENTVRQCSICQLNASNPKQSFENWPTSSRPWERVHIDYAGPFLGSMWLICVDAFSKYPYVIRMSNITAVSTIHALQTIFTIEGLPDIIVSDNGTSFTATEFQLFCKSNGIVHLTTAPFHPSSNGEAERFVRTFKEAMSKNLQDSTSTDHTLMKFLSTYRFHPNAKGDVPAKLLHGRQPKTLLSLMLPRKLQSKVGEQTTGNRKTSKYHTGDTIYARNFSKGSKWVSGIIIKQIGRMMYIIETSTGNIKRHQNQIRKRYENKSYTDGSQLANQLPEASDHNNKPTNFINSRSRNQLLMSNGTPSYGSDSELLSSRGKRKAAALSPLPLRRSKRVKKPKVQFDL